MLAGTVGPVTLLSPSTRALAKVAVGLARPDGRPASAEGMPGPVLLAHEIGARHPVAVRRLREDVREAAVGAAHVRLHSLGAEVARDALHVERRVARQTRRRERVTQLREVPLPLRRQRRLEVTRTPDDPIALPAVLEVADGQALVELPLKRREGRARRGRGRGLRRQLRHQRLLRARGAGVGAEAGAGRRIACVS